MFREIAPQNKILLLQPRLGLSLKDGKCLQQNWASSTPGVPEIASGLWEDASEIQTHMKQTHFYLDICPVIKLYEQHYVCSVKLDDTLQFWQSLGLMSFWNSKFQVENYNQMMKIQIKQAVLQKNLPRSSVTQCVDSTTSVISRCLYYCI